MLLNDTSENIIEAFNSTDSNNTSLFGVIDYQLNSESGNLVEDYIQPAVTGIINLLNRTITSEVPQAAVLSNASSVLVAIRDTITYDGNSTLYEPSFNNNLLAIVLSFFCMVTIFGNVLVMVAVFREPYLHTVTNYFIASLATADCIVGAVVMPFCVVLEVCDGYWPFGQDWCDIWRSIDVLASTASILNLCVISLDRYWAITDSMSYPRKMSPTRAGILIAVVWVCSALISFPAIAWWRAVSTFPPPEYQCLFTEDVGYLVFSSAVSFYVPLTVMLFTYYKIYRAAMEQKKSLKLGTKQVHAMNGEQCASLTLRIHRGGMFSPKYDPKLTNGDHHNDDYHERTSLKVPSRHMKSFSLSRKISKLAKERKAAKTLGIVMGVFILCWLPFFVTNVLMGICGDSCVYNSKLVFSVVTWLGWTNSGMNPVIYACWSRDFRRAFTKLLCFCCPKYLRRKQRHRSRFRQVVRDEVSLPHLKSSANPMSIEDISL
ncbi:dopamine receptor 2 [Caerostris darwini]|uniref:Dopamine receptor 2 n=2 Tax=Caerostris TaxID=172845 RepID=A0AAV4UMI8_9ARAC|nr:dopamine receptor 2 [Caerostris darwini]